MKKHLFNTFAMLMLTFFFSSCEKEGRKAEKIIFENGPVEYIEAAADAEEAVKGGLIFTTDGPWKALIENNIATNAWLSLSDNEGQEAGRYILHIYLKPNFSGKDRKASIHIICGDAAANFMVIQKTAEAKSSRLVSKVSYSEEITSGKKMQGNMSTTYTYDEFGKITGITEVPEATPDQSRNIKFDYSIKGEVKITTTTGQSSSIELQINPEGYVTKARAGLKYDVYKYDENGYLAGIDQESMISSNSKPEPLCLFTYEDGGLVGVTWKSNAGTSRNFTVDELYPQRLQNDMSIDLNFCINPATGSQRQLLYLVRLLGKSSDYLLENTIGNNDPETFKGEYEIIDETTRTYPEVTFAYDSRMCHYTYETDKEGKVISIQCSRAYTKTTTIKKECLTIVDGWLGPEEKWEYKETVSTSDPTPGTDIFKWNFEYTLPTAK